MTIGEKIRRQRKLLDIKQEELSKLVGVSLKTIQRWENGERSPRIEEMTRLAEALKISSSYLMEQDGTKNLIQDFTSQRTAEKQSNTNMAVITLDGGRKVEAPATPEGYAFLERLFLAAMGGTGQVAAV